MLIIDHTYTRYSHPDPRLSPAFVVDASFATQQPLADLPAPKIAVLGLITSKFPKMETVDSLKARIQDAASHLSRGSNGKETPEQALDRLCLSPQCGFASHAEGNAMTDNDVRRKLELVVKVASEVWPGDA